MRQGLLKTFLTIIAVVTFGLYSFSNALAQTAPKPFDPNKNQPTELMNLPEIIGFANADGSLDVAWRDHSTAIPKIYLTKFTKSANGYARASSEELPSLGVLAGFTKDDKGNFYHLTAEKGDGEQPKQIVLYKNKQKFWDFKMQDGDKPCETPKLPLDSGTAQIVTGAGKLFVEINLFPAHPYQVILDLENTTVNASRCARETLWHHNVDNRVFFDGKDFVTIENRDHEMTLSMMKFSPTEKYPFEPHAERLRSVYARTNNGNSTFVELGDIEAGVSNGDGYLVLFASERDWDDQMEGLNKPGVQTGLGAQLQPRDLAVVHVKKNFDKEEINWKATEEEKKIDGNEISQAPKLVDTTGVVNSVGTGKTVNYQAKNDGWDWASYNADTFKMIQSGMLAERAYKTGGVVWLTNYGEPFEKAQELPGVGKPYKTVASPKLIRLAPNNYVAVWEEFTAQRNTDDVGSDNRVYQTTKAMILTLSAQGANVQIKPDAVKDLGKIRVMAFDDAFNLGGRAAWVTGDAATKSLKLNILDNNLNHQAINLPLAGDVKAAPVNQPQSNNKPVVDNPQPKINRNESEKQSVVNNNAANESAKVLVDNEKSALGDLLLELEYELDWEALDDSWKTEREKWTAEAGKAMTVDEASNLLLQLESKLKWESMNEDWEKQRDAWVNATANAANAAELAEALIKLEAAFKPAATSETWKNRRAAWAEKIKKARN